MAEARLMNLDERMAVRMKVYELEDAGKQKEADALRRTMPIPAFMAQWVKKYVGADFLLEHWPNLAEAEAAYGKDWLTR
jgi:hypothetical protein